MPAYVRTRRRGCRLLRPLWVFFLPFLFAQVAAADSAGRMSSVFDLNGKVVGVIAGTSHDIAANNALDYTQIEYYDEAWDLLEALRLGEVEAALCDTPVARWLVHDDPGLRRLSGVLDIDHYAFAFRQGDTDLFASVNGVLRDLMANGTVDRLVEQWIETTTESPSLPVQEEAAGKVLRLGISPDCRPFAYPNQNGDIIGFDIALVRGICERLGYRLEIISMEYAQLVPSLFYGRVDMVGSCMVITDERKKLVHFSDSYYTSGVTAITLNE